MWFTTKETALLLGVSARTVRRWKREGVLIVDKQGSILFEQASAIAEQKRIRSRGALNRSTPLGVS